jgi:predicted tellurium resistance membrane protein TerC
MDRFLPQIIDEFLKNHPLAASLAFVLLAFVALWILTASGHEFLVYEGF